MNLGAWDAAAIAIKAITYAATLSAAGAVFFLAYSSRLVTPDNERRIRRWVGVCTLVALLTSVARISVLAGSMSGEVGGMLDGTLAQMILQAGEGRATGIRIIGLVLAVAAMFANRRFLIVAYGGALLAATSFVWVGHAHAVTPSALPVLLLSLHLLCVAFWLGALAPLLIVARDGDLSRTATLAKRFGEAALFVVALLIICGAALLWIFIDSLSELWRSDYGRLVTLKLALVACLLGLAALNKLRLTPRLQAQDGLAAASLQRSIKAEMVLAGMILLVTAMFTTVTGPAVLE